MTQHASVLDELTRGLPSYNPDSLSVRLAHDLIHSFVSPVGAIERVVLKNSLGRVLAEDIVSSFSVPAFDNSANGRLCLFLQKPRPLPARDPESGRLFLRRPSLYHPGRFR